MMSGAIMYGATLVSYSKNHFGPRILRNNDTFEYQEFWPLEIGLVFEVEKLWNFLFQRWSWRQKCFCLFFCLLICFLFTAFIAIMFAAVTSTTSKNVLKFKPRFIKLSNIIWSYDWPIRKAILVCPAVKSKNFSKKFSFWILIGYFRWLTFVYS